MKYTSQKEKEKKLYEIYIIYQWLFDIMEKHVLN